MVTQWEADRLPGAGCQDRAEEKKEKDKDDARVVDRDDKHARVWLLDVPGSDGTTPDPRAMTKATWNVDSLAWMPAGDQLILQATDRPDVDQTPKRSTACRPRMGCLRPDRAARAIFRNPDSPDGKGISYVGARDDGPSPHDLMVLPGWRASRQKFDRSKSGSAGSGNHWVKASVLVVAETGFATSLLSYAGGRGAS